MKDYIHITAGNTSGLSLTRSFELRDIPMPKVISLRDDLRVGPLKGIDREAGYEKRLEWWNTITDMGIEGESIASFRDDLNKMRLIKSLLEENQKLCIWYGSCLFDQLMKARLFHFIKPSPKNIFIVPVSDHLVTNIRGRQFVPETLVVMAPEQMAELDPYLRPVTQTEIDEAITMWEHATSSDATMRVMSDTILQIQEDSYFDAALLENCTNEFQKSARVVGGTLIDINFYVSDTILNWRLKELVRQNKLKAKGILRNMRDYEVKLQIPGD